MHGSPDADGSVELRGSTYDCQLGSTQVLSAYVGAVRKYPTPANQFQSANKNATHKKRVVYTFAVHH